MEDFFVVDIPVFIPAYDTEKRYGWSKYKDNLWKLLIETTGGYCMYCYDSVWINGQRRGQIEHGIEKVNSPEYLTDCIPNLGLACSNCNERYKRKGEVKRKLPLKSIKEFEKGTCKKFDCKEPCEKFKKLRMEYIRLGRIMNQPFEAKKNADGYILRMQYDLLNCKYIPAKNCGVYDKEELGIIHSHIDIVSVWMECVGQKERAQAFIYCKDTVPVLGIGQLKGHVRSPFDGIFVAAGRAEAAFAAERDGLVLPTFRAAVLPPEWMQG